VLWPTDLPPPFKDIPLYQISPVVPPPFWEALAPQAAHWPTLDLPDAYFLFHGPQDEGALRRVLETWSWAAGTVGDTYPLVLLGLAESGQARLRELAAEYGVANTVLGLAPMALNMLAGVYHKCAALFHPMEFSPWAGAVRLGLACAKPVVTVESHFADALVGPAAYLRPIDDIRGLGAALITVIVEEDLAASLQEAARQRAAGWRPDSFRQGLWGAYRSALGVK
jgi:glycosyltransferase involved in cell wall biosynthesis